MRSAFGRLGQQLRLKRGMNQKEFSELSGFALSHVSNLEHQRANISDDVVSIYVQTLNLDGADAHELRKLAHFSNSLRKSPEPDSSLSPLRVMFEQFGDRISPRATAEIQRILERETGEKVSALTFASNQFGRGKSKRNGLRARPSLSAPRFVEIALIAEKVRGRVCGETSKLDIGEALDRFSLTEPNLDYDIRERLPTSLEGAFAAILGHKEGHTIVLEESRFISALNGVYFARHAVAHELGHHFLHSQLLASEEPLWFAPQELAKNSASTFGSDQRIEQVVDTIEEAEAECFATFLLVPWTEFLKGKANIYLSKDFGEQQGEVERYARYFALDSVKDVFRRCLRDLGLRHHPIFGT